jgi:putative FmdB family regulatory protein
MPIFDYQCTACPERIELFRRHSDAPTIGCQKCGADMTKSVSSIGGYSIKGNNSASVRPKSAGSFKKGTK